MTPLKIGLIVGSTRPNRFADVAARWIEEGAARRKDFALTLLDLRDAQLPLFDEPVPPAMSGGAYSRPEAEAWRRKVGELDGYIATVAEYNHGPTAVLKNALDSAWLEWQRKPIAFVGYGGVGAARAIEHLRGIAVELQLAPLKHEVNITMEPFLGVLNEGKSLDDYPHLVRARDALFDDLLWWGTALRDARQEPQRRAA
jgi:NAD(P)H-dependent FMN reductase